MIIVNGWKPLTVITNRSILDVAAALDQLPINCDETSLSLTKEKYFFHYKTRFAFQLFLFQ